MSRRPFLPSILAFVLLAAGCGDGGGDGDAGAGSSYWSSDTTATSSTAESTTTEVPTTTTTEADRSDTHQREELDPPTVEIVDLGTEPRSPLRLHLSPGSTQAITMEVSESQQLVAGGEAGEEIGATYSVDLDVAVTSTGDDGIATTRTTYLGHRMLDPGNIPAENLAEWERVASGMLGAELWAGVDDRGVTRWMENPIGFSSGPEDGTIAGLDVPTIPLPEPAVGVGAKWRAVTGPMVVNGLTTTITTDYELIEVHDDRLVVRQSSATTTDSATIDDVTYTGSSIVVDGTVTWYLAQPTPVGTLEGGGGHPFTQTSEGITYSGEVVVRTRVSVTPTS